jgi:tripartite-type tricarboxylate transporter receptor subunit TctC
MAALIALLSLSMQQGRAADAFPTRAIRIVVPYAPGGGTDLLLRALQESLSKDLGQPIIIDNRPGAGGAIAAREVARATPDGYTLLVSNNGPSAIVPLLQPGAGYDPVKDFTPITTIAKTPIVAIMSASVPAKNLSEFVKWAQQQPDGVTYGSAGVGSLGHLSAELFSKFANVKLAHVPYRGQAPTTMAVLTGEIPLAFTSASDSLLGFINSGKIRLLGIGSTKPSQLIPGGVPIASVLPGYEADVWQGIVGPARLPESVVNRLHKAFVAALASPDIQKRFESYSYEVSTNSPAEFVSMINEEVEHWGAIIRDRGIRTSD